MSASGVDLDAIIIGPVPGVDSGEAELCARLIARYATSPDDGDMLAEILGIEVPARDLDIDGRIYRLADAIPPRYHSAYRRAVPDSFRQRRTGRKG